MYDGMYKLWWYICISYDGEPKLMYFLIEDDEIIKNIMIFWVKLQIALKQIF